jgi:hypothetical protein
VSDFFYKMPLAEQVRGLRMMLDEYRAESKRAFDAIGEAYALRTELEDLRAEVRDLTATPFDQE